jgi:ClpA/ClpB-like protein
MTDTLPTLDGLIAVVRSSAPGESNVGQLSEAVRIAGYLDEQADSLIGHFVDQARRRGASWSQIGAAMGVSKQAAQQRWVPRWTDLLTAGRDFARFTDRAKNVLTAANRLAGGEGATEIRPEHLVLAQHAEPEAIASTVLVRLGVGPAELAAAVGGDITPAAEVTPIGFDEASLSVLDNTLREALRLGHNYIGTEHLLLGALAAPSLPVTATLAGLGVTTATVEPLVRELLAAL